MTEQHSVMHVVCAWCGADMGTKDGGGLEGDTHSCCPSCLERLLAEVGTLKQSADVGAMRDTYVATA